MKRQAYHFDRSQVLPYPDAQFCGGCLPTYKLGAFSPFELQKRRAQFALLIGTGYSSSKWVKCISSCMTIMS